jgi:cellulose synthase operon protein C
MRQMRRALIAWTTTALAAVSLWGIPASMAQTIALPADGSSEGDNRAEAALEQGDYERARKLALRHDDAASLLVRARLTKYDGDLELAGRFAQAALDNAATSELRSRAAAAVGDLMASRGQWEQAEAHLREHLSDAPRAHAVRLRLGQLLIDRGAPTEAEQLLDPLSHFYNNGHLSGARQLSVLGEAMWAIGSFDDANFAFEQMYREDPHYVDGLVRWAELLLSKYNMADAKRTLDEALEVNDNHPGALVAMARLEMETKNYFDQARAYLDRAAEVAPGHPGTRITRAELAIYDSDCPEATRIAEEVLEQRPRHLDAFIIRAACHYLADDLDAFESVRDEALAIKPDFARLYTETARHAQLVHRYTEVVDLNREALELSEGYAPALLGLGIGLSRVGRESEAEEYLRRAFEADSYNVRAFNMVELYEKTMGEYDFTAYDKFKLRTHREQTGPLNVMVPPLVEEAIGVFEDKYDFEASDNLAVEIFPNPSTFGVRSVGLPHISPHGICFGQVVISRSPSDGNFNWKQVVWHELAHVYHIQKANYRVPRWFTEGLAEYETNVKDPAWVRHHDREIVAALHRGELPSVVDLDKHFTQARSYKGILRAYHLSSLVVHFIVEEHGFEAINAMLSSFPDKRETGAVIETVLEMDVRDFDKAFEAWLRRRFLNFDSQFVVSIESIPAEREIEEALADKPRDAVLLARLAAARFRAGKLAEADEAIGRALSIDDKDPTVRYLAGFIALNQGHARDAYEHGTAILDAMRDGYELRVVLGHTAMMLEKPEAARIHLEAATQLYPNGSDAWSKLGQLGETVDDEELVERAERRLFELDQGDPRLARKRVERLEADKEWAGALDAAERWVAVDPFDVRSHRAIASTALALERPERAERAYEVMVQLVDGDRASILVEAAEAMSAAGFAKRARRLARRAIEEGADKSALEPVLSP